jgi:hypothetical protein
VGLRVVGGIPPNGLEMSRPASAHIVSRIRFSAAGRVGSIELLGGQEYPTATRARHPFSSSMLRERRE